MKAFRAIKLADEGAALLPIFRHNIKVPFMS
jgi:hypothetical protein